jgi:P27 family predicted phage terminase small subunit
LVQGTARKDRQVANEAFAPPSIPSVPCHLTDGAKVEWGRVATELFEAGLLSDRYRAALALYCDAYDRWDRACRAIDQLGKYETAQLAGELGKDHPLLLALCGVLGEMELYDSGTVQIRQLAIARDRAAEQVHKYGALFAMDPAAQTRISVKPKDNEDDFDSFVSKRNKKA